MKKYILFKCENNELYDKLAYLNQDSEDIYSQSWLKPLKFNEVLACLRESDFKRKNIDIHPDCISCFNDFKELESRIYSSKLHTVLEENNDNNFLRMIIYRLGRISYLDYNENLIEKIEKMTSLRY